MSMIPVTIVMPIRFRSMTETRPQSRSWSLIYASCSSLTLAAISPSYNAIDFFKTSRRKRLIPCWWMQFVHWRQGSLHIQYSGLRRRCPSTVHSQRLISNSGIAVYLLPIEP